MIVSASRRTDIPAFFGEWLIGRLRAGEVLVRNPVRPEQVSRISLAPENVDALVFWTKNPAPFISRLRDIDAMGHVFYFLFTLTPYDRRIEPGVPGTENCMEVFRNLSRLLGRERVVWRYDPVILGGAMDADWHAGAFSSLAARLSGFTGRCIISFLDDYRKIRRRMRDIACIVPGPEQMIDLCRRFARTAQRSGIALFTCSEEIDLSPYGIMHSSCIDSGLIELIGGRRLPKTGKDRNQRKACGCNESRDIGCYDTCTHGCLYCYAVSERARPHHDPSSPLLCGRLHGTETITDVFF